MLIRTNYLSPPTTITTESDVYLKRHSYNFYSGFWNKYIFKKKMKVRYSNTWQRWFIID